MQPPGVKGEICTQYGCENVIGKCYLVDRFLRK